MTVAACLKPTTPRPCSENSDGRIAVHQFCRKAQPFAFSIERVFNDVDSVLPDDIAVKKIENRYRSVSVLPRIWDALRAWRLRGPVNHVLGDVHYLTFFLPRRRTILTIHDCEMITRALGLKRFLLKVFWLDLPIRRAAHVVAISEHTRAEIVRLAGLDPARIRIINNPLSAVFQPAQQAPATDRPATILHIGTKANKNLERLIEAAQGLPLQLLIVGHLDNRQRALLESSGVAHQIRADVSDDELLSCYAAATALSFVSLSEGFGLPIIEAQAVGRPVLTSNREPMRDVAGNGGALLVDPEDVPAIRRALTSLLNDENLRMALIKAGLRNVERFRASRIAKLYAELYREVARS